MKKKWSRFSYNSVVDIYLLKENSRKIVFLKFIQKQARGCWRLPHPSAIREQSKIRNKVTYKKHINLLTAMTRLPTEFTKSSFTIVKTSLT